MVHNGYVRIADYGSILRAHAVDLKETQHIAAEDDSGVFVERGRRQHDADFNGWTELPGWEDPTRVLHAEHSCGRSCSWMIASWRVPGLLRLELGNPCPDCFGLKKSSSAVAQSFKF